MGIVSSTLPIKRMRCAVGPDTEGLCPGESPVSFFVIAPAGTGPAE